MEVQDDDMINAYPDRVGCFPFAIVVTTVLLSILLSLCGCKVSRKVVSDDSTNDSVRTEKVYVHDTTSVVSTDVRYVRDTTFVTKWDATYVSFVPEGGTFNISTGEATGVTRVSRKENTTELNAKVESLKAELAYYKGHSNTIIDSVSVSSTHHHSEEERQSDSGVWWWLLPLGVVVGASGIVALKKIPVTKPFMFWL